MNRGVGPHDTPGRVGPPIGPPPRDVRQYWHEWLDGDGFPFWSYWDSVRTWWAIRNLPNVMLVHYSNLKRDLLRPMCRMAGFLDIPIDGAKWKIIVEYCSFDWMKQHATKCVPLGGAFSDAGARVFINQGKNGRWTEALSAMDRNGRRPGLGGPVFIAPRIVVALVVILIANLSGCTDAPLDSAADLQALTATLSVQADAWDKAIVRKDRSAIEANMAEDFRQIDGAGNVETKASFVNGIVSPDLEIDPYTVEDFDVRHYGDVALLSGRTHMTGRYQGSPFTTHYRYIDIYVQRSGDWKIVSVQITRIPDEAPPE